MLWRACAVSKPDESTRVVGVAAVLHEWDAHARVHWFESSSSSPRIAKTPPDAIETRPEHRSRDAGRRNPSIAPAGLRLKRAFPARTAASTREARKPTDGPRRSRGVAATRQDPWLGPGAESKAPADAFCSKFAIAKRARISPCEC